MGRTRQRTGSYNAMLGFLLPVAVGFAALAVDTSWLRLAESQSQDVADAAAHAALVELRHTGSTARARSAAEMIIDENRIGGAHGTMGAMEFGFWDRETGQFDTSVLRPNAVHVHVGRYEARPLDLHFAKIWDRNTAVVDAAATAATRSLHVVLVMDVTGSFWAEIHHARDAAIAFLEVLEDTHGEDDMIGMSIYTYKFAWEWTPMFFLSDPGDVALAKAQWAQLNVASKDVYGDDFATGGKYPQMPREYADEPGTDHHVGIVLGRQMIVEQLDPFAYRAMVVLTDGDPNGLGVSTMRDTAGYVETRWRQHVGPTPHSDADIEAASVAQAQSAYDQDDIHVWTVSFRANREYLSVMPQGDGKFYFTTDAAELTPIFEEIANSMPLLIVK
jgi:hypothetical protein